MGIAKNYWLESDAFCRLTNKFVKRGRYASKEENGEDMRQRKMTIAAKRAIFALITKNLFHFSRPLEALLHAYGLG
jgi:hypothetical protein